MSWRRKWKTTPLSLPRKPKRGHKELDTEDDSLTTTIFILRTSNLPFAQGHLRMLLDHLPHFCPLFSSPICSHLSFMVSNSFLSCFQGPFLYLKAFCVLNSTPFRQNIASNTLSTWGRTSLIRIIMTSRMKLGSYSQRLSAKDETCPGRLSLSLNKDFF